MNRKAITGFISAAVTACLVLSLEGLADESKASTKPLDVGDESQLFVDRHFIDSAKGIELVVNPPKKMGRVLVSENPWEEYRILVQTVLQDGDVYRMYYSCMPTGPASKGGTIRCRHCDSEVPDNTLICECGWCPSAEIHNRLFGNIAYAESKDGIHWKRPNIGWWFARRWMIPPRRPGPITKELT